MIRRLCNMTISPWYIASVFGALFGYSVLAAIAAAIFS